jgi:hypothetical protein
MSLPSGLLELVGEILLRSNDYWCDCVFGRLCLRKPLVNVVTRKATTLSTLEALKAHEVVVDA